MKSISKILLFSAFVLSFNSVFCKTAKKDKKIHNLKIEILSGNPKYFKNAKNYHVQFDYSNLKIGKFEDEQSYIQYMMEDAEKRKVGSSESWLKLWNEERVNSYQPRFIELLIKHSKYELDVDTIFKNQQYVLNLHTQFIEIGYNKNTEKSPTYINVIVTIHKIGSSESPLIISMAYITGKEFAWVTLVNNFYSPEFRRIEEAYAKCGKELAIYMRNKIY